MAKKQPTAEQISNVLNVGYFGKNNHIKSQDPIEPTPMKLPIGQVDLYDKNPRRSKNPEYDSILESLRANGQEEALTITRRPDSEHFMIRRGGNTRLEIMKMLYDEAGDTRFAMIECLFLPWTNEADCLIGHLNENTTQGRMTLIDKARGYRAFKEEYEKEHHVTLGQRKLAELLKENGASVSRPQLQIMDYALNTLEPIIPNVLANGLGKPHIEKIKRLDQTFQRLVEAHSFYDEATRDAQRQAEFHHFLSQFDEDTDNWSINLVIDEFTSHVSRLFQEKGILPERIKYDIQECLKRDPWKIELISIINDDFNQEQSQQEIDNDIEEDQAAFGDDPEYQFTPFENEHFEHHDNSIASIEKVLDEARQKQQQRVTQSTQQPSINPQEKTLNKPKTPKSKLDHTDITVSYTAKDNIINYGLPEQFFKDGKMDIKSMRGRIYTLALQFSQSVHLQECIMPMNSGYGYFCKLPRKNFRTIMSIDQSEMRDFEYKLVTRRFSAERNEAEYTFAWWLLFQIQGLVEYNDNCMPGFDKLPECTMKDVMHQLYDPKDEGLYSMSLHALDLLRINIGGPRNIMDMALAYQYIKPANMMKFIELLHCRTQMMAYIEDNDLNIWEI